MPSIEQETTLPDADLTTLTISSKYQVVIPKAIRERLHLEPGQKVRALVLGDRIELIPVRPMKSYRGLTPGIETSVPREPDRL